MIHNDVSIYYRNCYMVRNIALRNHCEQQSIDNYFFKRINKKMKISGIK